MGRDFAKSASRFSDRRLPTTSSTPPSLPHLPPRHPLFRRHLPEDPTTAPFASLIRCWPLANWPFKNEKREPRLLFSGRHLVVQFIACKLQVPLWRRSASCSRETKAKIWTPYPVGWCGVVQVSISTIYPLSYGDWQNFHISEDFGKAARRIVSIVGCQRWQKFCYVSIYQRLKAVHKLVMFCQDATNVFFSRCDQLVCTAWQRSTALVRSAISVNDAKKSSSSKNVLSGPHFIIAPFSGAERGWMAKTK